MPLHVVNKETTDPQLTVFQHKTILTDAQIKALPTTPVEVVPAPGSGKMLAFNMAVIVSKFLAAPYSNVNSDAAIPTITYMPLGSVPIVGQGDVGSNWILTNDEGVSNLITIMPVGSSLGGYATDYENKPLVLTIPAPAFYFTGGDPANTLEITVFYSIIDM